jgi:hypothetical protein
VKIIEEGKDGIKLNKEDVLNKENNYPLNTFKILTYYYSNINLDLPLINGLNILKNKDLNYNYN